MSILDYRGPPQPSPPLEAPAVRVTFTGYSLNSFRPSEFFPRRAHVTIAQIQRLVAMHFRLRLEEMWSARRDREVARPRQIAMYICRKHTKRSLPEIGRKFGGRDHTTVMHAVRQIEKLQLDDPELAEDVRILAGSVAGL